MSIGIFGGTFDPIHLGHLLIAEQAYNIFKLEKVIFMPAGIPPHKVDRKISDPSDRLEMVKLAINDNPHFDYSDYELSKEGRSYTADTLRYLKRNNNDQRFFFIIGADSLLDIYMWKDTHFLLKEGNFIVARRPGFSLQGLLTEEKYKPYRKNIHIMDSILLDVSSSGIREAVKRGNSIRYQTVPSVIKYIEMKGLYRGG